MNKIFLIGNLVADPELRTTSTGITLCDFRIAVNRRFTVTSGERQTDFFRITAWRQLGENCARYLSKGKKVAVVGELQARTYVSASGETRMSLDVSADEVEFLSPRGEGGSGYSDEKYTPAAPNGGSEHRSAPAGFVDVDDDQLPF